ncbi:CYCLIN B1-5 [Trifolium repens]|nr:CYCLIN B1-5 [Trifolium repens]
MELKRWLKDWTLNMLFRRNSLQNQSLWKSLKSHMKRTMRKRLYQHSPHQKRKIIRIDRRTPDIIFVTKHNMEKAVADLTTKLQHASDVVANKQSCTLTSVLTARSKAACGLTNKPKEIVDIDAGDANNELAAVEYLEDIYK